MIRRARPTDTRTILDFIRALAAYEKLESQLEVDEGRLQAHLFGPDPACGALVAEVDGAPAGFALFYRTYSTFKTMPCMHLEDLFVLPHHRGRGLGLGLLRALAAEAVAQGCPRLDWNVLDWNEPAIGFYRQQGAVVLPDWRICRLEGAALRALASRGATGV